MLSVIESKSADTEAQDADKEDDSHATPLPPELNGVDLLIPRGKLTFVVGRVGSGKSTLLAAMLQEVPIERGSVAIAGSIAFCNQKAWILNSSVRGNILFGQPFDRERYKDAVTAADMWNDFVQFPDGDRTEIGERGINLSGGQKQRVAFARAVYANADTLLLDDVLSAVDVHVGENIMNRGILGSLAGKTRVLVTHAVHFAHHADCIVVVADGRIKASGTLAQLREQGIDLTEHVKSSGTAQKGEQVTTGGESKDQGAHTNGSRTSRL